MMHAFMCCPHSSWDPGLQSSSCWECWELTAECLSKHWPQQKFTSSRKLMSYLQGQPASSDRYLYGCKSPNPLAWRQDNSAGPSQPHSALWDVLRPLLQLDLNSASPSDPFYPFSLPQLIPEAPSNMLPACRFPSQGLFPRNLSGDTFILQIFYYSLFTWNLQRIYLPQYEIKKIYFLTMKGKAMFNKIIMHLIFNQVIMYQVRLYQKRSQVLVL